MSERPISEVLDLAADAIQARGWAQSGVHNSHKPHYNSEPWGDYSDTAPVCLEGAIYAALGRPSERDLVFSVPLFINTCPAGTAVREYLGLAAFNDDDTSTHLYRYNDAEKRTVEEVIEVLRAAAAVERVKESAGVEVTV